MQSLYIPVSRFKQFFQLIFNILMLFVCCTLIAFKPIGVLNLYTLVGTIGVLYFGSMLVMLLKHRSKNQFSLRVDGKGVTDHTTLLSVGFIPWEDITAFELDKIQGQNFLLVDLKHPEKYIKKNGGIKGYFLRYNRKKHNTPIVIATGDLKCDVEHLKNSMEEHLLFNQKHSNNTNL